MKNIFLILILIITTSFTSADSEVYICGPQGAKKYHYSQSCRGLSACNHGIVKVQLSTAKSYGLTLCGWED